VYTFRSPYNFDGRGFVGFNVDLVLLRMLHFSTRILFCANVYLDLCEAFCMLCPEDFSSFSYNMMYS